METSSLMPGIVLPIPECVKKFFTNCAVSVEVTLLLSCFSLWIIPDFLASALIETCFFRGDFGKPFHILRKWIFLKTVNIWIYNVYKFCCFHVIIVWHLLLLFLNLYFWFRSLSFSCWVTFFASGWFFFFFCCMIINYHILPFSLKLASFNSFFCL